MELNNLLITGLTLLSGQLLAQKADSGRPNILIILADDMGYSDLGCYGSEIQTPNLDKLARNGVRFTQFYNCARCCPTRASLLTGQYPQSVGINGMGVNLNMNAATIAEVLKMNGYHTGMTGKWHLSQTKPIANKAEQLSWLANRSDHGPFSPLENYPCNRGFEEHYGTIWGVANYFDPFSLVHNELPVKELPKDFYLTDYVTEKSLELIDQFSSDKQPYFLYVAYTAPHWPLQARPEDIAKYRNKYRDGWDALRNSRYQRMIDLKLIDPVTWKLPSNSSGKKWADCVNKDTEAENMAAHAAMVDRMDQGIGLIIKKLNENHQLENTIIFFLSDNGASYERGYPPGFDRPAFTRDSTMIDYNSPNPGSQTTWNYLGDAWASAVNTPYRFWKKESYEGGTKTPFIVSWPAKLSKFGNTINKGVGHVIDLMPTCLNIAGAEYPGMINGLKTNKLDGRNLMPLILGETTSIHDTLFWEHEGGRAARLGNWKIASLGGKEWELFNLEEDRTETNNLASKYPGRVKEMDELWKNWMKRVNQK
jgi:arylsulfatase